MKSVISASLAGAALLSLASFAGATSASAQGRYVPGAREGGDCRVPYPTQVFYGAGRRGTTQSVSGRGIPCSNDVFGDPAPGVVKTCAFLDRGGGYRGDDGPRGRDFDRGYRPRNNVDMYEAPRRRRVIEDDDDF